MIKGFSTSQNRYIKAKKIESILEDFLGKQIEGYKILEVGCGSGIIAGYFSHKNDVYGVDIENKLNKKSGKITFYEVNNENLPFKKDYFDIVISNHVIEHVSNQSLHLSEIKRVMKNSGIFYFTIPNKNFPIEPHYKIPFIHYLGRKLFHLFLKLIGKYKEDLNLLSYYKQKKYLNIFFGFKKEYTGEIIKYYNKYYFRKILLLSDLSLEVVNKLSFLSETNIFICKK